MENTQANTVKICDVMTISIFQKLEDSWSVDHLV